MRPMQRRVYYQPTERDIRHSYRSLLKEGAPVVGLKVEAATGDITFLIDESKPCRPYADVLDEVKDLLAPNGENQSEAAA